MYYYYKDLIILELLMKLFLVEFVNGGIWNFCIFIVVCLNLYVLKNIFIFLNVCDMCMNLGFEFGFKMCEICGEVKNNFIFFFNL